MSYSQTSSDYVAVGLQAQQNNDRDNLIRIIESKQKDFPSAMAEGTTQVDVKDPHKGNSSKRDQPKERFIGTLNHDIVEHATGSESRHVGGQGGQIPRADVDRTENIGEEGSFVGEPAKGTKTKKGIRETYWDKGKDIKQKAGQKLGYVKERAGGAVHDIEERAYGFKSSAEERLGQTSEYIKHKAHGIGEVAGKVRETVTETAVDMRDEMDETLREMEEEIEESVREAASTVATSAGAKIQNIKERARGTIEQAQARAQHKVESVKEQYESMVEGYERFKIEAAEGHGPSIVDKALTAVSNFASWLTGSVDEDEDYEGYEVRQQYEVEDEDLLD